MNISEKVAYLKGLADGMKLDTESNEGKLLVAILDVLEDVADSIDSLEFDLDVLNDEVSELDDELMEMTDIDSCCGHHHGHYHDDYDDDEYDGEIYEVTCPKCGAENLLDEDALDEGELDCIGCGEKLEIDFSGVLESEEE